MNTIGTDKSTFEYWGDFWLSKKKRKVSYSQFRNLQCYLNHIYRFIGDKPIADIKTNDIDNLLDSLTEKNPNTNKPMSHQYLLDIRSTTHRVFETAIDNDIISKNPARGREISKYAPAESRRALTEEEQKLIIITPHRARIAAMISMLCGARRGEVIPMTLDDINLDDLYININKSVEEKPGNHFLLKMGTKSGIDRCRKVPIPLDLAIELEAYKKVATSKYICSKLNGEMHTPTSWKRMWSNYIKTIIKLNPSAALTGIDEITFHYLRHTYATLLYTSGVDVLTASKLMGHSNIKTTLTIYTHLEELKIIKSIESYDSYISTNLFNNCHK